MNTLHHEEGYALISISIFLTLILSGLVIVQHRISLNIDIEKRFLETESTVFKNLVALIHTGDMLACNTPNSNNIKCKLPTTADGVEILYYVLYNSQAATTWDIDIDDETFIQNPDWCQNHFTEGN